MNKKIMIGGGIAVLVIIIFILSLLYGKPFITIFAFKDNGQLKPVLQTSTTTSPVNLEHYIEITDGCNPYYVGTCVNMREGAGSSYPVYARLRTGVVLKVSDVVTVDGQEWYKIIFATELMYPERVKTDLFVAAGSYLKYFEDIGDQYENKNSTTTKRIIVDVSQEMLYAYDGEILFMKEPISTGLEFTPTPHGTFSVFKKTPTRFMQGPIPGVSDQIYDLPGVPWDLYFTEGGAVIHGAYWHDHFGKPWSHGCVNLSPQNAKKLYDWAVVGTTVTVQN